MHQGPCTAQSWSKQEVLQYLHIQTYRKGSIAYRVPEFLCCRTIWDPQLSMGGPHTLSRAKLLPPLSFYYLYVYIAPLHSLAGVGGGWPQILRQHSDTLLYWYSILAFTFLAFTCRDSQLAKLIFLPTFLKQPDRKKAAFLYKILSSTHASGKNVRTTEVQ